MNQNVKKITDGAMMIAIVGVVLIINRQFAGLLESMVLFLFPLPMVFYSAKYGWKDSWVVLAAMGIIAFLLGTPQTVFYALSESILGLVYGGGVHAKKSVHKTLVATMVIGVIVNLVSTIIFASFFGYDLDADITVMIDAINQAGVTIAGSGIDLQSMMRNIFVITAILTGVIEAYLTHFISRILLKRFHIELLPSENIVTFMPPVWSGYVGIVGFVGYYYSLYNPLSDVFWQTAIQTIGMACFVYLVIFGMIGMIVVGGLVMPKGRVLVSVFAIFCMLFASIASAIFGFLYITTTIHKKALQGGFNVSKNE